MDTAMVGDDVQKRFEEANTMLDKVRIFLEEMHQSEVIYNKMHEPESRIGDIALIQCFYGTNPSRIRATMQALEFNLQMTSRPSSWVFVECQKKRSDCAFQWLQNHGIKHVFVKSSPNSDGIMLKNPLWTIGAKSCSEPNLCFVDSDVVMCSSDWIVRVKEAFAKYDVLTLASHQYYQHDDKCKLHETIGYKWVSEGTVEGSHVGFTLGMTRKTLEEIGGLEPAVILADVHTFHKILGEFQFKPFEMWYRPFRLQPGLENGHNVRLGYADNIACHIWHEDGNSKYRDLTKLLNCHRFNSIGDILDTKDPLPTWKKTPMCQSLKNTILNYYKFLSSNANEENVREYDILGEYYSQMKGLCGGFDEKHPLFVCTTIKNGFGVEMESFVGFRDAVENKFINEGIRPIVLFFTDCKFDFKEHEINVAPLTDKYDPYDEIGQCLGRKDIKFPKDCVLYFIPSRLKDFNERIWIPSERIDLFDGTSLIPYAYLTSQG